MTKAELIRKRDLILAHQQTSVAQGEPLMVRIDWDAPTLIDVLTAAIRGWEQDRPEEMVSVIAYGPGGAVGAGGAVQSSTTVGTARGGGHRG